MMHQVGKTLQHVTLLFLVFAVSLMGYSADTKAELSVTVDRTEVTDADLIKLTIRISNTTTASNPNFSAIERDFDIMQLSGPNQSSRISIINGRQTSEVNVSWELRLRPKRLGNLTIPGFRIGPHTSSPINVQVKQQSEAMKRKMSQLVFFDTSVDTTQTYVQGQILYTIKLYYVENISGDFPPMPSIADAVIETIEDERRYDSVTNGRRYYVLEKRYGIYPQKSGELKIPAQNFSGYRVGPGFFSTREPVLARSKSHIVNVKPKPVSFSGAHWLPAADLSIEAKWLSEPDFTVGEPVNRSIEIRAEGVAASLLPELPEPNIEGVKTYQDPPAEEQELTNEGIISKQTVVVGIVPTKEGSLTLPEISIPWWNTKTDQLEYAVVPAETFTVAPSPQKTVVVPSPQQSNLPQGTTVSAPGTVFNPLWQYVSYAMFSLWMLTLLVWYLTAKRRRPQSQTEQRKLLEATSINEHWKHFEKACRSGQGVTAQQQLAAWANATFEDVRTLQGLSALAKDPTLTQCIEELESQLYSPNASGSWNGARLLEAVRSLDKTRLSQRAQSTDTQGLTPTLNPN